MVSRSLKERKDEVKKAIENIENEPYGVEKARALGRLDELYSIEEMLKGRIAEHKKKREKVIFDKSYSAYLSNVLVSEYCDRIIEDTEILGDCQVCGGTGEQEGEGPWEDGPHETIPCAECGGGG